MVSFVGQSVVISAHGDPASSRATATVTTLRKPAAQPLLGGPRAGHGGRVDAALAGTQLHDDGGPVLVGPGRLDQLGAQVSVAGLGDVSTVDTLAGGVLAGHQSGEAHEGAGGGEAPPVADLAGDAQRTELGYAVVGGQPGDRVSERAVGVPVGQVGLDGPPTRRPGATSIAR